MTLHRLVVTGGHSGLGFHALRTFLRSPPAHLPPPYHIILYARDISAASTSQQAVDELSALQLALPSGQQGRVEVRPWDLKSLKSAEDQGRTLAEELAAEASGKAISNADSTGNGQVDVFFLNAGIVAPVRSVIKDDRGDAHQGKAYDEDVLVNHIAPLVFLDKVKKFLLESPRKTRIVFTGSGQHRKVKDPVAPTLRAYFDQTIPKEEQRDDGPIQSYSASKFVQLLGALELTDKLRKEMLTKDVEIVYAQPGFVPNTGLNRNSSFTTRLIMQYVFPYLPMSAVTTVAEGSQILSDSLHRDLADFPMSEMQPPEHPEAPSTVARVTFALIAREYGKGAHARKGARASQDPRSADKELQRIWWPQGAFAQ